ncbi:unnamed protein product [Phytophthora lilii]|uniref:Unnamed protein product n=1 Tax=Phytophthora lilii TaxID=2077276 RepID=A0A9W6XI01_9STRA|nr:unnamed protein product [Phytophthora lilii]
MFVRTKPDETETHTTRDPGRQTAIDSVFVVNFKPVKLDSYLTKSEEEINQCYRVAGVFGILSGTGLPSSTELNPVQCPLKTTASSDSVDPMILKKDAHTPGIYNDAGDCDEDYEASSCNDDSEGDGDEAANNRGDCAESQGPTQEAMNFGLDYSCDYIGDQNWSTTCGTRCMLGRVVIASKTTTNNLAENMRLLMGLQARVAKRYEPLYVIGDTTMITRQQKTRTPPKTPHLKNIYWRSRRAAGTIGVMNWNHHLRRYNKMTDTLANLAMDTKCSTQVHIQEQTSQLPRWRTVLQHLNTDFMHWRDNQWEVMQNGIITISETGQ